MHRRLLLLLLLLIAAAPAAAALSPRELAGAVARPGPDAVLPGKLVFTDTKGRTARLSQFADGRPLVLIFADFTCRHICGPGLTLAAANLHATGLVSGRDYRLAVIGIDPRDTQADAVHFGQPLAALPDVADAANLLRGDPRTIAVATRALGYGYVYDTTNDQFAHDASLYVFAPDGRLRSVLPELGTNAVTLRSALTSGAATSAESWTAQVAHLCYGFAAAHGRFGRPILIGLQCLSLLLLGLAAALFWRRQRAA